MIATKAFAVGQKTIKKKGGNPLLDQIIMPKLKGLNRKRVEGEEDLEDAFESNSLSRAFMLPKDNSREKLNTEVVKKPIVVKELITKNPMIEQLTSASKMKLEDTDKVMGIETLFPKFVNMHKHSAGNLTRAVDSSHTELSRKVQENSDGIKNIMSFLKTMKKKDESHEGFSEEMMEDLTYKIFQNVRDYLEEDRPYSTNHKGQQIKIELSI